MSLREKYGDFIFENMRFIDNNSLNEFMDEFKNVYGDYIYKIKGKKTAGESKFGFLSSKQKQNFGYLKVEIDIDELNSSATIYGWGHREVIFQMQRFVRKKYDDEVIISYYPRDNVSRMREDVIDYSDGESEKEHQRKWDIEQKERISKFFPNEPILENDNTKKSIR